MRRRNRSRKARAPIVVHKKRHKPATHWLARHEAERERADEEIARRLAEADSRG